MAAGKQCDNCGVLYPYNQKDKINAFVWAKIDSRRTYNATSDPMDLCPDCIQAIKQALEGRKNHEELIPDGKKVTDEH